jgi:hypothetical protein
MKKTIIFILFFLFIVNLINAQSIYFNKRIDMGSPWETCHSLVLYNNGYLVLGTTLDSNEVYEINYLSKIDSLGNIDFDWTKFYFAPGVNYYTGFSGALFQTKDKNYAFCGSRVPGYKGYGILIKVDSLGNKKWEKEYQLLNFDNVLYSGNITNDSGYILTGDVLAGSSQLSYLLIKTDSLGNQQWYKTYTDNHPSRNYHGVCVTQTPDDGYCIGGTGAFYGGGSLHGITEIIKTDNLGSEQWKKTYGNPNYSNGGGMFCISKDSCIIATYSLTTLFINGAEEYKQPYLIKLGLDGSVIWERKIANVQVSNVTTWIKTLEDGSFILSGGHRVKDTLQKNIGWFYKIKSNGDSLWYREYANLQGPNEQNELRQVTPTPDGGYIGAGTLWPNGSGGGQDVWLFKTDSVGCLIPDCSVGISEFNPNAGAQMLIYPNPFKEAFAINYNLPKESKKGVFELRDLMGRLVYSTGLSNNVNQLQVVASSLKAGIYVASFVVDGVMVCCQKIIKE